MSTLHVPDRMAYGRKLLAASALALLAACGGGGGDEPGPGNGALTCSVADQKTWLRSYFNDWYYWYRLSPSPSATAYGSASAYFDALLYNGSDADFPADRWSNFESTEAFNRFFGAGQSLGYGVSVAGLEVSGLPAQPLYVRYVEPLSPAAGAGVVRGDRVMSVNGRSAADLIATNDFSSLSTTTVGQQITLMLRSAAGADRSVTIAAATYALSPVPRTQVVTTPLGRKLGYVVVKDMVSQATTPLDTAFAEFRRQAVNDVVIDLRYNGGGLVTVGATLASYVSGSRGAGQTYASLLYNDKRANVYNESFPFTNPASALGLTRVYVLTGRRTCSASEQIINGLRGVGVQVVAIGETTCGKPVGFLPQEDGCGTTYSVVNFESVNARNEGRYFNGFQPTCQVAENFTQPMGSTTDPLMQAARTLVDGGACPVAATREQPMSLRRATPRSEPDERQGMMPR